MTPPTGRRVRAPRAEPIIVGEELSVALLNEVREALAPRDVRVVASLFEAVENTGSLAHVSAILMAPSSGFNDHEIVDAFRKVDPSVRLVLLIEDGEEARGRTAIEKGFDAAVNPGRDLDLVAAAIEGTGDAEALHRRLINRHSIPSSEMPPSKNGADEQSVIERVLDESFERANREEHASETRTVHGAGMKGMIPREHESQMVQAMIENRDIQPIGLQIIRQRTGIENLQFLENSMEEERRRAGNRNATILAVPGSDGVLGFLVTDDPKDAPLLASWIQWLSAWMNLQRKNVTLLEQAWTDHLTGAGNRRALEDVLERVIARSDRTWRFMSLMCFDIDNFKKYNDKYGHAAGDEVLRETVLLVKTAIRKGDHVFRVGGDEFVVVFSDPEARADQSQPLVHEKIARRIQSSMGKLALPNIGPESPERISISSGLVTYPWDVLNLPGQGTAIEKLLSLGDQRALESKRSGKNKITLGPDAAG